MFLILTKGKAEYSKFYIKAYSTKTASLKKFDSLVEEAKSKGYNGEVDLSNKDKKAFDFLVTFKCPEFEILIKYIPTKWFDRLAFSVDYLVYCANQWRKEFPDLFKTEMLKFYK